MKNIMVIKYIENELKLSEHMQKEYVSENFNIVICEFSHELNYVLIKATDIKNSRFFVEKIDTGDLERFKNSILSLYGIEVIFEYTKAVFSKVSINKAQALVIAGFTKLIRQGDNYTVDNIFPQNFLTQEELDYLLKENIEEILLSEIK